MCGVDCHQNTAEIGTNVPISPDTIRRYMFDTPFERELKAEVFKIVRRGKEFGTYGWYFRCAVYLIVFFGLQYRWVVHGSSISLAIFYGIAQALIGMNVQHDANHGAASKNPWINDVLGLGADMIGSSRWLWMEQHWTHHAHTNNADKDPDATTAEPFLLFNNYSVDHVARKWFHKFQAIYATFLMSAYWLASVTNTEVLDLKHSGAAKAGIRMENGYIKGCRKYATALRILYIYVNIITPFQRAPFLTAFGHVMLMGVAGSLVLAILFSMSHNFQGAERHPTSQNDSPVCWFKSQVETSCTYGGFVSGALTGGLNFQIEHHLFPRMSSAWYPYIAPTVRDVCQRHGVRYTYYPWMWQNWRSTLQYMHETGNASWKEGNPYSG